MTMAKTLTRSLTLAALLAIPLPGGAAAFAQDAPAAKDDALDNLLKKLEEKDKEKAPAKPSDSETPKSDAGRSDNESPKAEPSDSGAGKPSGEVSGKDKELDSLLEKLGATEDKPSPDEKRPGGLGGEPKPGDPSPSDKAGDDKKESQSLKGKDKAVDEHLEELAGKRRKKKQGDEGDNGPLSEVIKEMRDVEQRLSKPDTGEETRNKQIQIVKRIETLIEQARSSSSSQSQKRQKKSQPVKPGQQPGDPEDQPGPDGGNAPFAKPQKPTNRRSLAGGKSEWGHLPPELRQEMDNVFNEDPLPSHEELIRRYYLSVSRKNLARGR